MGGRRLYGEMSRRREPGGILRKGVRRIRAFGRRAGENTLVIAAHGGTQMAVLERYAVQRRDYYAWCAPNGGGYILCADRWQSEKTLELVREVRYEKD